MSTRDDAVDAVAAAVLGLLERHPAGLRRPDLRALLVREWARDLPALEVAQLDTRLGHALTRLKDGGQVVHVAHRQAWQRRAAPAASGGPLPATDPRGVAEGEQEELF